MHAAGRDDPVLTGCIDDRTPISAIETTPIRRRDVIVERRGVKTERPTIGKIRAIESSPHGIKIEIGKGWCVGETFVEDLVGGDESLSAVGRSDHIEPPIRQRRSHRSSAAFVTFGKDGRVGQTIGKVAELVR